MNHPPFRVLTLIKGKEYPFLSFSPRFITPHNIGPFGRIPDNRIKRKLKIFSLHNDTIIVFHPCLSGYGAAFGRSCRPIEAGKGTIGLDD